MNCPFNSFRHDLLLLLWMNIEIAGVTTFPFLFVYTANYAVCRMLAAPFAVVFQVEARLKSRRGKTLFEKHSSPFLDLFILCSFSQDRCVVCTNMT
jgi:hypothetical protein